MIPKKIAELLSSYGLTVLEFEEGSTPTAETAAIKIGVQTAQIAKSMLFKGKSGRFYLAVCPGDSKISSSKMKALTGEKVSMATAEETEQATGYRPGGVCPFCLPEDIPVFLDRGLEKYKTIYPAAGTNSSGVPITFPQLKEITAAPVVDLSPETGTNSC